MKLVTWNVNSLGERMPRVLEFLEAERPDIACLPETKVADDAVGLPPGPFPPRMGLRIDVALVSETLAPRLRRVGMVRDFRKGKKPSDHAPLVVELEPAGP
ncbi:MAG TPA: hypothetical protein VHF51_20440 [Solirubrobacteraceae bacterium]|nr:hypothetical protein [Solirubrobacteraceae bacterium]